MSDAKTLAARPPAGIIALCLTVVAMLWAAPFFDVDRSEAAVRQSGSIGSEIARSTPGGIITRVHGFSPAPEFPHAAAVGLATADALVPIWHRRIWYPAVGGVLTLILVTLTWFLARGAKRRRGRQLNLFADERVKEQKTLLDMALNNMRHGLLMFDSRGRALVVNRRYAEMYGLSPEAAKPGCTVRELLELRAASGTFAGNIDEYIENHFVNDRVVDWTYGLPDGRSIRVVNGFLDNGGWVSTHEDVTLQRKAEEERDRNREFLDRIIDNITITIQVKDARTLRYVLVNKAAEKLWGVSRDRFIGKTPHEIFDKKFADTIVEHDRQLLASRSNFFVPEHKIETPCNGTRIVTSNRIAVRDNNDEIQYLVGVVEDMTERKAVEDQLRQAQKMEAIGNLTGGVAHDFNNLLTVIMGNLDLLQEDVAGNPAAEEKIDVILEAAERGADLTRHMLAVSRRQPLQAKEVDVNALIATTMRLLSRTLGGNISVVVEAMADPPIALVDSAQLETALLNIAINARDAMPSGGTLAISTRVTALDETYAALHPGVAIGSYVTIELADTGIGMSPELLERIFEPFFTTKSAGQGTGLGLSMVYGFIKQSGGHISAYSELGRGTVFRLFLPVARPLTAQPAAESIAPPVGKPSGNEVILAVEDNPEIRATVVRQLRDLGYRVYEAESADAALKILDASEPINLLFTDMIMPGGLNGKELATKARARRTDLRVLFTSGFPGTPTGHGAKLEPGDVLLSKPYRRQDLAKAVEAALLAPR